jgi:hypothetical protein
MSRDLANARLLTVDGYGHTEFINKSTCADAAETAYFISGKLPPAGAACHQNQQPFGGQAAGNRGIGGQPRVGCFGTAARDRCSGDVGFP